MQATDELVPKYGQSLTTELVVHVSVLAKRRRQEMLNSQTTFSICIMKRLGCDSLAPPSILEASFMLILRVIS